MLNNSPKILFWSTGGMHLLLHVEGALAMALAYRGADVHFVVCDGTYRACFLREIGVGAKVSTWGEPGTSTTSLSCNDCKERMINTLVAFGLSYSLIGDLIDIPCISTLKELSHKINWQMLESMTFPNADLGKNIKSAVLRYLKGHQLDGHEEIVSEYAFSALINYMATESAISRFKPTSVIMSHGIYVDFGPALQTFVSSGIPVTLWTSSYLKANFFLRTIRDINDIDPHRFSQAAWKRISATDLAEDQLALAYDFIDSRYRKRLSYDIKKHIEYKGDMAAFLNRHNISRDKPIWGIFSHVNWDCVSELAPMIYEDFDQWLLDTLGVVITVPEIQWIVKIHPIEARENPDSGAFALIRRHFPALPEHIAIINSDDEINSLDFLQAINGGVTVYGTPGLELAMMGKPVILAGEAHFANKGFTHDSDSKQQYRSLLKDAPSISCLAESQRLLALKYAYCYFIQRLIPFDVVNDNRPECWEFQANKQHSLLPGSNPYIDFICEKIFDGNEFLLSDKFEKSLEAPTARAKATVASFMRDRTDKHKFVSVIIPAYNRATMIGVTLESFINQDYPKDRYEIIVSDNNSTDNTKDVVFEWQRKTSLPIAYIFEERQGVHYARNSAAKIARGEILYFTDDDMIADASLLTEIVKVFDLDPKVGTATGRILPRWEVQPPDWILRFCYNGWLSVFDELGDGIQIDNNDFGVYSCHQAIRKEALFAAGGYNPETVFAEYIGDGETGLNIKLKKLGYRFGYNGMSLIHHMIPSSRMTQDYLNRRIGNQGSADSYSEFREHRFTREQLALKVNGYLSALLNSSGQSVLARASGDEQWRIDKAYTYYYLNRIEYDLRLMEDHLWREQALKDNWMD